jgi:uncharacterized protein
MSETGYEKPLPMLTKLNAPYWEGTKKGELRLQKCTECGHHWFPPSAHCPNCVTRTVEWVPVSGRGKVWSWVVMHQRYFKAFADDIPYVVAFIELEEGPMMMSTLVDIDREDIRCDMPVTVVFEEATDEMSVPKFRPA